MEGSFSIRKECRLEILRKRGEAVGSFIFKEEASGGDKI